MLSFLGMKSANSHSNNSKKYLSEHHFFPCRMRESCFTFISSSRNMPLTRVLLREVNGKQRPIFFVNKTLMDCQIRYLPLEKLVLALILTSLTSQKLMHYFQVHPITVYTEFLLKNILSKADLFGRLSKWATELG